MMIKDWCNFYTPSAVAERIIDMIPLEYNPKLIVDICVGSGNFLDAALSKWDVNAIGVDVKQTASINDKRYSLHLLNALEMDNLGFINDKRKKLVLANPPFGKMDGSIKAVCSKHRDLQQIAIRSKRIETNMIVSNMSLLKPGEIFAAILPENIFSSEKLSDFKTLFFTYFEILHLGVAQNYFSGSEVSTRIFIGRYYPETSEKKKHLIEDFSIQCEYKIIRGLDNSKIVKNINLEKNDDYMSILHFSNKEGIIHSKSYVSKEKSENHYTLNISDLLISRVGRNSGRVFVMNEIFVGKLFSDYFYAVKNPNITLDDAFVRKLENMLLKKRKGLTAKYICKKDIEEALIMLNKELMGISEQWCQ